MAKGLSVLTLGQSAIHARDNVVEVEAFGATAPDALLSGPFAPLQWGKFLSVSPLFRFLVEVMFNASRKPCDHGVSIIGPADQHRGAHFLSGFWGLFPAFLGSSSFGRIKGSTSLNSLNSFGGMRLSPKRIVRAASGSAFAICLTAGFANAAPDQRSGSVEHFPANHAGHLLAGLDIGHGTKVNNGVNSGNNCTVQFKGYAVNPEPSRACNGIYAARGTEGVTTRAKGNGGSTSAPRESDDIVWASWRHEEAVHKQFRDNKSDDILNISPSDVFTAAQYPFAQAAAAVSISGLEMLQNSGKEKMIDLLESRIKNAERTMMNNLSNDCYSNGTADGGKQIGGLQLLVSDVANSGTVGGIDRSVWGFWQPNSQSFATNGLTPGPATIQTMMNRTWLQQARQADKPDLIISDNTYFRYYWESLQAIQRIGEDNSGMAGFMSLKFMNADVVYDGGFQGNTTGNVSVLGSGGSWLSGPGAPASHMYFLNTDYIFLRPHKDRDMVPLDPDRFSVNQDAMVKLVAWAGNMTMSNAFLQGVIIA